jgi:hypothetical protein
MEVSGRDGSRVTAPHFGSRIVNNPTHVKIKPLDMKSNEK